MCYPKPGPRCYSHARESLQKAAKAYKKNPNVETKHAFVEALDDYDATPGGMKELEKKIKRNPDDKTLQKRLEEGKERRQKALEELALSKDYGDVYDTESQKWQGIIILEDAHQAGLAAEKKAIAEGYSDLVDVDPLGRNSIANRRLASFDDDGRLISQNVFVENQRGNPIAQVAKELHKESVKEQKLDEGWWKASLDKWHTYAVKTGRGDAYNEAYAAKLKEHGVEANHSTTYVPENSEEVYHMVKQEAGWTKDSHDLITKQRGEELEEASNIFKEMRGQGRSSDEIFASVRATAAQKVALFNYPEQAGRKRAWQEVDTLVKWSQSKTRREAQENGESPDE